MTEEICEFLDIQWYESLIYYYKQKESLPSYDKVQHKLSTHKPDESRKDAYKDTLSNDEITVLEFLLNKEMKQHNYIKSNKKLFIFILLQTFKSFNFWIKTIFSQSIEVLMSN